MGVLMAISITVLVFCVLGFILGGGGKGLLITTIISVVLLGVSFWGLSNKSSSYSWDRNDVAYDDSGFLGYSDGFWEWYHDNN